MYLLIFYNLCIAFFSSIPLFLYYKNPSLTNNHFKSHLKIFILKLLFISMFIYIFINNFRGLDIKVIIISGYFNFTFFHIIEGYFLQKLILNNGSK